MGGTRRMCRLVGNIGDLGQGVFGVSGLQQVLRHGSHVPRIYYINGYVAKDHDAVDVDLGEYVQK